MLQVATPLDALRSQRQGPLLSSLKIVMHLILTLLVGGFWLWMGWDLGGNSEITGNEKFT